MRVGHCGTEAETHPDVELDAGRVAVHDATGDDAEMVVGAVRVCDRVRGDDGWWAESHFEGEADHDRFVDVGESHAEVSGTVVVDGAKGCGRGGSH